MYTLDELQDKTSAQLLNCLLPMERAVHSLPVVPLSEQQVVFLRQGKILNHITYDFEGCVRLHNEREQFIGLGELQVNGVLSVRRLLTEMAIK
jgi:tRNA pseudouridine55 synthase